MPIQEILPEILHLQMLEKEKTTHITMATNVLTSTLKGTQLADPNEVPQHLANNFISPMGYTTSAREGCGSKKSAFEG